MSVSTGEVRLISSTSFQVDVEGRIVNAVIKGKRLKASQDGQNLPWDKRKMRSDGSLCVGDKVALEYDSGSWKITGRSNRMTLFSRYNFLKRRVQAIGANFDILCIIVSHSSPEMNPFFVNTALLGLRGVCDALFVFTKSDLEFSPSDIRVIDGLSKAGFKSVRVSSATGEGIASLKTMILGRTALFAGESGVGKSSLLNAVLGREIQNVGNLSKRNLGCHTTASSVLVSSDSLRMIDTPGMRFVRPVECDRASLDRCFPELMRIGCRFADCAHMTEEGCLADSLAESGKISPVRLSDYRRAVSASVSKYHGSSGVRGMGA